MSGGPFRELFVELSREAFEIAKGIGEQAVRRAEEREKLHAPFKPSREQQLLDAINWPGPAANYLANRYDVAILEVTRSAASSEMEVRARLHCGHLLRLRPIDELVLHLAPSGSLVDTMIDALDKRFDEARRCYCVRREP